jgi:para-aminobenzoate synthetase component 1
LQTFEASMAQPQFEQTVARLKTDIFNGEIYQANLSIRLQKTLQVDPYALFERLCGKNPSPFSGFFKWPGGIVVCNSPERLVSLNESGRADTRPIAGTRGRGKTPADDLRIGQTLLANEKERAEHLMLVDLARNDLGRVCQPGSVRVDDLLTLERYSHVTHLVSNVTGQLRADCTGWDLIKSLFPGGTITGCPKIRCVEILNAVEPVPRGFYTGSLGFLDAISPALDLNILIRSLFLKPTTEPLVYNTAVQIGGGIVHDSVGAHEARECLRKATASLNELYAEEFGQSAQTLHARMPQPKEPAPL